jgi:hypothetical protein
MRRSIATGRRRSSRAASAADRPRPGAARSPATGAAQGTRVTRSVAGASTGATAERAAT